MGKIGKIAEAEPAIAAADAREPPAMKSGALSWQNHGFVFREAVVRLPKGMLLQDLQDVPTIWKNVQSAAPTALRRFDRLICIAFDESWLVDAIVTDADNTRVVLAFRSGDVIRMSTQSSQWEDERHRIRWDGVGFAAFRKLDGVQVLSAQFATIEAAKAELFRQFYVVKVA